MTVVVCRRFLRKVDAGVGQVVGALQRQGLFANTLLLFLGDNGGVFGAPSCNGRLRGGKGLG